MRFFRRLDSEWNLTRWGRLCVFVGEWGPWYTHYATGWRWMTPRSYLRVLWARATEPINHQWPVKGPNDTLIVEIERLAPRGCYGFPHIPHEKP